MIQTIINSQQTLIMDAERKSGTRGGRHDTAEESAFKRGGGGLLQTGFSGFPEPPDTATPFKSAMPKSYYPHPISPLPPLHAAALIHSNPGDVVLWLAFVFSLIFIGNVTVDTQTLNMCDVFFDMSFCVIQFVSSMLM